MMKYLWIYSDLLALRSTDVRLRNTDNLHKARRDLVLWRSPDRGLEILSRLGIVQLDRSEPAGVKEPSHRLSLIDLSLECRFGDELVGLVVLPVGQVRSEQEVDHGDLEFASACTFEILGSGGRTRLESLVFPQRGGLSSC